MIFNFIINLFFLKKGFYSFIFKNVFQIYDKRNRARIYFFEKEKKVWDLFLREKKRFQILIIIYLFLDLYIRIVLHLLICIKNSFTRVPISSYLHCIYIEIEQNEIDRPWKKI